MAPTPLPNVDPDEMRPFAGMIEEPENEKLYKTTAPKFGKEMLKYFAFDKGYRNLNNGGYLQQHRIFTMSYSWLI